MKNKEIERLKADRTAAIVCLSIAFIIFAVIPSQTSPRDIPGSRGVGLLTGRFFPVVGTAIFSLFSMVLLINSSLKLKKLTINSSVEEGKEEESDNRNIGIGVTKKELSAGFIVVILSIIYINAMQYLGYLIMTMIGVGILTWTIGNRNLFKVILCSLIIPTVIYFVFSVGLGLNLPRGLFFK